MISATAYRKRRLRKKYQVGEFTPKNFTLNIDFDPPMSEEEQDRFWYAFIAYIEQCKLSAYGTENPVQVRWRLFSRKTDKPVAAEGRGLLCRWLAEQYPRLGLKSKIMSVAAGPVITWEDL